MPPVPQALVRAIPESGRKSLYLASHAGRIFDMPRSPRHSRGGCHYFTTRPWPDGGAVGSMSPWRNSCFLSVGAGDNRGGLQHVRLQLAQC
jgi:hypothetical protein